MAVEPLNFDASVNDWVRESKARMLAVFQQSTQDVVEEMQKVGPSVASTKAAAKANPKHVGAILTGNGGHMPVDTGFLRASLRVSTEAPVPIDEGASGGAATYDSGAVVLSINNAKLGDVVYATYTAAYAARINYGFSGTDSAGRTYNDRGYHFVELAAQQWQAIVTANVGKLQKLTGAK